MRQVFRVVFALALLALVAGCGAGPRKRINPPGASIQELAVQPSGQWKLTLRVQNFSSVPITFDKLEAKLVVAGEDAGRIALSPALTIGPEAADVVTATLAPAVGAKIAVASALASRQSVRYTFTGTIDSHEPSRRDDFKFESALSPAPGLTGVLR